MKTRNLIGIMLLWSSLALSQDMIKEKGRVIREMVKWESIENNPGGEAAIRGVSVYLPRGYSNSTKRYPVIYYLHGLTRNDSTVMSSSLPNDIDDLLNYSIDKGDIKEVILVVADHLTKFGGSFYTNSELTGRWEDFASKEVVNFIDAKYRTINHRDSRGVFGHSMGGYGTMRLAMNHSETFGVVYAMSAPMLEVGTAPIENPMMTQVVQTNSVEELSENLYVFVTLARTFSPNLNRSPFQADFPIKYENGKTIVMPEVIKKWRKHVLSNQLIDKAGHLKKLNALKLDWGRNDPITSIPEGNRRFSKLLESFGVEHFSEEYLGKHWDKLLTYDGRYCNNVFPFFDRYLKFE